MPEEMRLRSNSIFGFQLLPLLVFVFSFLHNEPEYDVFPESF
jgi:hypothetical protein